MYATHCNNAQSRRKNAVYSAPLADRRQARPAEQHPRNDHRENEKPYYRTYVGFGNFGFFRVGNGVFDFREKFAFPRRIFAPAEKCGIEINRKTNDNLNKRADLPRNLRKHIEYDTQNHT